MKQNYRKKSWKLLLALSLGICVAHTGYAMPSDGNVAFGNGSISADNGTISGLGGTTIINWGQFGIAGGETVTFTGAGSGPWAVLNRVTGGDASSILGTLNGTGGTVFLINPNGIVFGGGASINTASFVASTLDINNDAFKSLMSGGKGDFTTNGGTGADAGKIRFSGGTTGAVNFNGSNATFMGKSIEIDAGVNLTLGNSTSFLAGPNIALTNTTVSGNFNMTAMNITGATADNFINIKGDITSTGNSTLAMLGGKVDLAGNVNSTGDLFIAAGKDYSLEKNGGDLWFGDKVTTSAGNIVTIATGATITNSNNSDGESAILANSVTNNGTITVNKSLNISVLDNLSPEYKDNKHIAGHITSTAANKFTNNGKIEAGNMEVLAGAIDNTGTLKTNGDMILIAANDIKLKVSNDDNYHINNATADNTINSSGTIDSTGTLAMLGGKVDLAGKVNSTGDLFIAAGNNYSLEKTDGDFWFAYDKMNTSAGNTITIAKDATISTNNESEIIANSVTNNGTIIVYDNNNTDGNYKGLQIYVLDNFTGNIGADGKPISATASTSKNNKFTNNGTVTVKNGARFDVVANAIDNKGTITATHGDVVLTGNLSGNAIENIKPQVANDQYTGIFMTPDAKGNLTYSFINPAQIPEVEKGSALEAAINKALDILTQKGATLKERAKAIQDIIQGHTTAGVESSKENTKVAPALTTVNENSATNNLVVADNNTSSNLTVEDQEVQ